MITPMKKYSFLIYHRDYPEFLEMLGEAGVVHVIGKESEEPDEALQESFEQLRRHEKAIRYLSKWLPVSPGKKSSLEVHEVIGHVEALQQELDENSQKTALLKTELSRLEPWGNYKPESLKKLEESGWSLSFYSCTAKQFDEKWTEDFDMEIINRHKGRLYFAILHKTGETADIDADPEKLPPRSPASMADELAKLEKRSATIYEQILNSARPWNEALELRKHRIMREIDLINVENTAAPQADGKLMVLEGWVPDTRERSLLDTLEESGHYYVAAEPSPEDKVPVLLKNNSFAKLFEPISKLFDLPKYTELDLTPFFAPFFVLFFGFCLGDAGYGLIFILAGFLLKPKIKAEWRPILTLAQYLGVGTVLFGALSGTFFGINLIDSGYLLTAQSFAELKSAGLPQDLIDQVYALEGEYFKTRRDFLDAISGNIDAGVHGGYQTLFLKHARSDISLLSSFRHLMQDSLSMFYLAMVIGGLQILFGMVVKIVNITRQKGFAYSLSTLGWVILALNLIVLKGGGYFGLLNAEKLDIVFKALLIVSAVLIFLFNNPKINVFLRIGSGVWETYNVVTGVFGDLLSYIRLFALGISSAILGFVFNEISSQFLSIPYIGWLFFLLLLIIGHTINLFMATLGGFIHPMRLTFVEFYKNAGFSGGGKEYKPFSNK